MRWLSRFNPIVYRKDKKQADRYDIPDPMEEVKTNKLQNKIKKKGLAKIKKVRKAYPGRAKRHKKKYVEYDHSMLHEAFEFD